MYNFFCTGRCRESSAINYSRYRQEEVSRPFRPNWYVGYTFSISPSNMIAKYNHNLKLQICTAVFTVSVEKNIGLYSGFYLDIPINDLCLISFPVLENIIY